MKPKRKRFTRAERNQILESYHQSQLSQKEFVEQAGICLSTLQRWLHEEGGSGVPAYKPFIEIPNLLASSAAPATYRLEMGGWKLEVRSGFKLEELGSLLRTLQAL